MIVSGAWASPFRSCDIILFQSPCGRGRSRRGGGHPVNLRRVERDLDAAHRERAATAPRAFPRKSTLGAALLYGPSLGVTRRRGEVGRAVQFRGGTSARSSAASASRGESCGGRWGRWGETGRLREGRPDQLEHGPAGRAARRDVRSMISPATRPAAAPTRDPQGFLCAIWPRATPTAVPATLPAVSAGTW